MRAGVKAVTWSLGLVSPENEPPHSLPWTIVSFDYPLWMFYSHLTPFVLGSGERTDTLHVLQLLCCIFPSPSPFLTTGALMFCDPCYQTLGDALCYKLTRSTWVAGCMRPSYLKGRTQYLQLTDLTYGTLRVPSII